MDKSLPLGIRICLGDYAETLLACLSAMENRQLSVRVWRKDPGLWKDDAENAEVISNSMGWLDLVDRMSPRLVEIQEFATEARNAGFRHVVHMGMGGSSLAPLALLRIFGIGEAGLPLTVLDSTDPATILDIERSVAPAETLFIEAGKSGSTIETRSFGEYFYETVRTLKGDRAGENFAAVTDPGSVLEGLARRRGYRKIFLNFPDIGGRFSALSCFGMVPAALLGIDLRELLNRAGRVAEVCAPEVPPGENPAVALGAMMGELAKIGRDKLTVIGPSSLSAFGMWLEQLIAESSGKEGMGILPVVGKPPGPPEVYGNDRFFVYLRLENDPDKALDYEVERLRKAGHPLAIVPLEDRHDLGGQFLLWEIATAAAGAVLRINPFDQPDVQESKRSADRILGRERGADGWPREGEMILSEGPLRMYAAGGASSAAQSVARFLGQGRRGDFIAFLAYLTETPEVERALQSIRVLLRDGMCLAATVGYGPRYLHSTGQLHKGGPNTGLFLLLTSDNAEDARIPGRQDTFGMLRRAQALGDFETLRKRRRRVLRIHITGDEATGLGALEGLLRRTLARAK